MDRIWWAAVQGAARIGDDWATNTHTHTHTHTHTLIHWKDIPVSHNTEPRLNKRWNRWFPSTLVPHKLLHSLTFPHLNFNIFPQIHGISCSIPNVHCALLAIALNLGFYFPIFLAFSTPYSSFKHQYIDYASIYKDFCDISHPMSFFLSSVTMWISLSYNEKAKVWVT